MADGNRPSKPKNEPNSIAKVPKELAVVPFTSYQALEQKLRIATEALEGVSNAAVCVAITPPKEHRGILEHIQKRAEEALQKIEAPND